MNIAQALKSVLQKYQAGNLKQAEITCKKILKKQPQNIDALNLLGAIFSRMGNYDSAITYIQKALNLNPHSSGAYLNLGAAFKARGQLDEAIACYEKAIELSPVYADAYFNLGNVLRDKRQLDKAIVCYQKALQMNPGDVEAHNNLGNLFKENRQLDEAIGCYEKALQLNPNYAEAYSNLGNALKDKRLFDEAIACYSKALELNPNSAITYYNLAISFEGKVQLDEAITSYQKALQLNPDFAESCGNLGNVLHETGHPDEAEECYRRAVRIKPDFLSCYSNFLLALNYNARNEAHTIFSEHLLFAKQHEDVLSASIMPHGNDRTPDRRLRIGYVSPDFKQHSVAYFMEPVLIAYERKHFETYCYANSNAEDEVTNRLKKSSDYWRNVADMSDLQIAELIRDDAIDILVDLAGHTANNRMLVFARKPAPVQVSWIGYPTTTGLSSMDYKIVDSYTDPPGMTEHFYTEKLIRLPDCFLCYLPDPDSPDIGNLPAIENGYVTFGSFNNFAKISPEVLHVWKSILKRIPKARIVMKAKSLADISLQNDLKQRFADEGIDAERIRLLPWIQSSKKHLDMYNSVDIALDTFPYNGTTTTCESLWMGVPVITLAGKAHVSRVGVSLLSNMGFPELIASSYDQYIEIAVNLASDITKLSEIRQSLRSMISNSPLTDAKRFTAHIEHCYVQMWKTWCESISVVR
jgi:predicted O-linked N-acetylglucosamine transferase (SPINDLY family)